MSIRRTSNRSSQDTGFYNPEFFADVGSRIAYSISPDPDAEAYLLSVEAADGEALEAGVVNAITDFVVGCKSDGIWDAVKASCILAGARTLAGALVPLVGTAPTNNNFVSGDYSRTTGLVGDGSTKYLDSNRNNNADPQNNNHNAFYRTSTGGVAAQVMATAFVSGENTFYDNNAGSYNIRNRTITLASSIGTATTGFAGVNRSSSSQITLRSNNVTSTHSLTSQTPRSTNIAIFGALGIPNNPGRLSFYSIGESLDLALLDNRVTVLMSGIQNAIP